MEEKIKSNVLIYIIVVLSLIIVLLICGGIVLYKKLMNNSNSIIQNEENHFYNYFNNQQNNTNINQYDGSIKQNITLNNENLDIEFHYINESRIEENEESNLYSQEYIVKINDVEIEGIENGSKYIDSKDQIVGDLFSVTKIKDTVTNNEYLVLNLYEDLISAGPTINVYIIDYKEGKVITKLVDDKNCSALFLKDQMNQDDDGEYILSEEAQLKMEILDNEIISYEYNSNIEKVEKKIYTIENDKLNSKVDRTYETSEILVVGKSW